MPFPLLSHPLIILLILNLSDFIFSFSLLHLFFLLLSFLLFTKSDSLPIPNSLHPLSPLCISTLPPSPPTRSPPPFHFPPSSSSPPPSPHPSPSSPAPPLLCNSPPTSYPHTPF